MAYSHVHLTKYKAIYLCFEEYDDRIITFKEVKTYDTLCIWCINLFAQHHVHEYICDYFNYTLKLKNLPFLCLLVWCLM